MPKVAPKPELSKILDYAKQGFSVLPVRLLPLEGGKIKKKPLTMNGFKDATRDPAQITRWFKQHPDCAWGIATGQASGVTVVDLDVSDNADGRAVIKKLLGSIPKTPTVSTISGGLHLYFRYTDGLTIGSNPKQGVDYRNDGGFVVIPPSGIDGKSYKWLTKFSRSSLAKIPPKLLKFLQPDVQDKPKAQVKSVTADESKANALVAIGNILPTRAINYDTWVQVLMALHSVDPTDSQIVNAALGFSRYSKKHSDRDFFDKWNHAFMDDGHRRVTPGTLVHLAQQDSVILEKLQGEAEIFLPLLAPPRFDPDRLPELAQQLVVLGARGRELFVSETMSRTSLTKKQCTDIFDRQQLDNDAEPSILTIREWAETDDPKGAGKATVTINRKVKPLTVHYEAVLDYLGLTVQLNEMNDVIYINGRPMNDIEFATLYSKLREFNLLDVNLTRSELLTIASKHRFHPIQDRLREMMWDGEPHIQHFAETYVMNEDGLFPILFRKTMIGAVRRILFNEYTPMLVLESQKQGTGKSKFVEWLASVFKGSYCTINPRRLDKNDEIVKLCDYAIAEMPEIDSLPRDDQELVKNVLTTPRIQLRRAYDRYPIDKPVLATIIGTLNFVRGFMSDPTGHRRFWPCSIEGFDWRRYTKEVDPEQIWAEAVYAVLTVNETSELSQEFQAKLDDLADRYKEVSLTDDIIFEFFEVTGNPEEMMTTLEILNVIALHGNFGAMTPMLKREITRSLKIAGVKTLKRTTLTDEDGTRWGGYVWGGIRPKATQPFDTTVTVAEKLFSAKIKES